MTSFEVGYDAAFEQLPPVGDAVALRTQAELMRHIAWVNNSWWHQHRALGSSARIVYGDIYNVPADLGRYDTSFFGCILLHLRDPDRALQQAAAHTDTAIVVTDNVYAGLEDPEVPVARFGMDHEPGRASAGGTSRPGRSPGCCGAWASTGRASCTTPNGSWSRTRPTSSSSPWWRSDRDRPEPRPAWAGGRPAPRDLTQLARDGQRQRRRHGVGRFHHDHPGVGGSVRPHQRPRPYPDHGHAQLQSQRDLREGAAVAADGDQDIGGPHHQGVAQLPETRGHTRTQGFASSRFAPGRSPSVRPPASTAPRQADAMTPPSPPHTRVPPASATLAADPFGQRIEGRVRVPGADDTDVDRHRLSVRPALRRRRAPSPARRRTGGRSSPAPRPRRSGPGPPLEPRLPPPPPRARRSGCRAG